MRSTIRLPSSELTVFRRRKDFCSAKILAGGLRWGWGPRRSRQRHRPRKEISRGNLLCAKSGLTNLSYPRLESAQKYVCTPDWENLCTGQPRGARGTAVPLFREESRGTPSKGFLWATSSRRLDTALLFADKKRGVESTRLAGHCQSTPGPWTTEYQSPGASLRGFCVIPQSHSLQDFWAYQYRSLFAARYNTQTAAGSPRPATAGTSAPYRARSQVRRRAFPSLPRRFRS